MEWYEVKNIDQIDSPGLLVYTDRVAKNIDRMIEKVGGNPKRLFPHVKTHKMAEVVAMQMTKGITKFKCSTIAELEMVANSGATEALIAYQMVGPKIERLRNVALAFPTVTIASLVDNIATAKELAAHFSKKNLTANVYLDVDNGMHRTGCPLDEDTFNVAAEIHRIPNINFKGLHVYDGQFRTPNLAERKRASDLAFRPVYGLVDRLQSELQLDVCIINGGSPSFSPASMRSTVFCSPGTVFFWDAGYQNIAPELGLDWAAVLISRIISKPTKGIITVDLGHKSVGAENPIHNRIRWLNLTNYEAYKHSEEHLMLKVDNWENLSIGQVLYGVPFHVCPSVALHEEAHIIRENEWTENWQVVARKRKLTF
ncbi:MAG: D-TA family PLP-dependent enzyme [Bacteroidota bacterium]